MNLMTKHRTLRVLLALLVALSLALVAGCTDSSSAEEAPSEPEVEEPEASEPEAPQLTEEEQRALLLEERRELEAQRKEELGEFYVPLPAIGAERQPVDVEAHALYVTANVAGFPFDEEDIAIYAEYVRALSGQTDAAPDASRLDGVNKLERILGLCQATEVNALVIDVKNDDGLVGWESDIPIVAEVDSHWSNPMPEYQRLMDYLEANDIYTIARIVAFKDPHFAKQKPEHAIQLKAGGPYRDKKGVMWVNPFDPYVWDYNVALSKEAALRGFDEIQYDYVRFPDNAKTYNPITEFPGRDGWDKDEAIEAFLAYADEALKPYGVHTAADVFGVATRSWDDQPEDIGQTWRKIANQVDYICPMIYPSHYGANWYGYAVPDQHPYGVLRAAVREALERNAAQSDPAVIRPWIQGFDAPWVPGYIHYDARTIAQQIVACAELGVGDYIIWDPSNTYDPMIFFYHDRVDHSLRKEGEDILGRTPQEALSRYLKAERNGWLSQSYLLLRRDQRLADYDAFAAERESLGIQLTSYDILEVSEPDERGAALATATARYQADAGTAELVEETWRIVLEDDVYKIVPPAIEFVAKAQPEAQETEETTEGDDQ